MYARSTTVPATLSSIDAGIAHVRDEVQPALMQLDGFVGMSMMVDRESGMCVVTSAWRDAAAMHASKSQVQVVRTRAAEILGGSPMVEEWEIAVMHRDQPTHDGACVRSVWMQGDPAAMDNGIDTFRMVALPRIEAMSGFCSASLMIDRDSGRAVSSTCFDSRSAMDASREMANQIRAAATQEASMTVREIREFDLALAHLRVPELV